MKILVTGCAGFIGYHLCKRLLKSKRYEIYGLDNLNNYYDVKLKNDRLNDIKKNNKFKFFKINIIDYKKVRQNFTKYKFDVVIHLAAQAGVRHSIHSPKEYVDTNIVGFFNIIDASKEINVKHFIYASTSSVYGDTKSYPTKEKDNTSQPLSFYAATKKSNEVMAYSYSNIFKIPTTGLRFFTVYGNYGRPDMALFKFTHNIYNSKKIDLYNHGNHQRDFTHVNDVVQAITKLIKKIPKSKIPFNIFNVGSDKPKDLKFFLDKIEKNLRLKAKTNSLKLQPGDVKKTHADVSKLKKLINYKPQIGIGIGIANFVRWYKKYYK